MAEITRNRKTGERVKIGTCEMMYYIRHDQRNDVDYDFDFNCFFRLHKESEKEIEAGYFEDMGEGMLIYNDEEFFTEEQVETLKAGVEMVSNGYGVEINLPCYHNLKLPEIEGLKIRFNGKRPLFELKYLLWKQESDKLFFTIECRSCGKKYICDTEEAKIFSVEDKNKSDLQKMIEYVEEHNESLKATVTTDG
jgi:hypothetical protein